MNKPSEAEEELARQLAQALESGDLSALEDSFADEASLTVGDAALPELQQAALLLRAHDRFDMSPAQLQQGLGQLDTDFDRVARSSPTSVARNGFAEKWQRWLWLPVGAALSLLLWFNRPGTLPNNADWGSLQRELAQLQAHVIAARVGGAGARETAEPGRTAVDKSVALNSGMRSYRGRLMASLEASGR